MNCNLRRSIRGTAACRYALATILSCILVAAARADVSSAQTIADVQCIVVGARLTASSDRKQKQPSQMLLSYFLGRVDGRSPNVDLEALIEQEARRMTPSEFRSAAHRCGTESSARGAQIVRIGKSLARLGM